MVYAIILSLIAGALCLYYFLFKNLDRFTKNGIPHQRPLPLVGNIGPTFLRMQSIGELLKNLYDIYPEAKYIGMYDLTTPVILLRDPELCKSVALKHFDQFPDHRMIIHKDQDPMFSNNLFTLRGDRWREVRALLSPSFTSSKMKNMFLLMSDCAVDFANFVAQLPPEQKVMQSKDYFTRYTCDVIATCAFGVSVDSMRNPQNLFYVYGKEAAGIFNIFVFVKFYIFTHMPWLARILNLRIINKKITSFFQDLVKTTVGTRDEKGIVRPDMLQLMMDSRGKKEGREDLTMENMTSQAFIFFLGGFDGTATLMSFAAHEIAVNEDIRKRLQDEVDQVLEDTNGQAPYDTINNMEYLDAVLCETLRKYPLSPMLDRVCVKDFVLPPTLPGTKPYTLKKGDVVFIPVFGLHYDPHYFKEPEKFNPDRFIGEQKKQILSTGAYLPFGLGPRMCIGNRFALLETKVLLFHLLARCDLLPSEKTPIQLTLVKNGFVVQPEGGFWLKAVPRKEPHRTIAINDRNSARDQ